MLDLGFSNLEFVNAARFLSISKREPLNDDLSLEYILSTVSEPRESVTSKAFRRVPEETGPCRRARRRVLFHSWSVFVGF